MYLLYTRSQTHGLFHHILYNPVRYVSETKVQRTPDPSMNHYTSVLRLCVSFFRDFVFNSNLETDVTKRTLILKSLVIFNGTRKYHSTVFHIHGDGKEHRRSSFSCVPTSNFQVLHQRSQRELTLFNHPSLLSFPRKISIRTF